MEEILDLPARSRFGEGRAEPLSEQFHTTLDHSEPLLTTVIN